jgi:signal transduction histidine kinase
MLVPQFADICSVEIVGQDGELERLDITCNDPAKRERASQLRVRNWLAFPGSDETIGALLGRGETVFVPSITGEWLDAIVADQNEATVARSIEACSAIIVPLRARNNTLGSLALVMAESGRHYIPEDLNMAQLLGSRAGISIDNARLYSASRRAIRQLREANRAKDEFLGLMSHELRTPVTTIYGNSQVLQRRLGDLDTSVLSSAIGDIRNEAERLQLIIENLLALARSSNEDFEPVVLSHQIAQLQQAHLRSHQDRQLIVTVEGDEVCVTAHPKRLELVLRNLLDNAEKYSPIHQPIEIAICRGEHEMIVRVLDRGHGIAPEEIEDIFQPFFRSPAVRDRISGVGIGLTVCKRLIEAQGGRIWVRGRAGGGLELCIAMPVETEST